jgi:hypothetical protein
VRLRPYAGFSPRTDDRIDDDPCVGATFSQYLLPVTTATLVFPAFALVLLVPFSFVAYRRRGRLGAVRSLVFFGFVYSVVAASLPVPVPALRCRRSAAEHDRRGTGLAAPELDQISAHLDGCGCG